MLGLVPAARAVTRAGAGAGTGDSCDWPMYGQNPARTMSTACPAAPNPSNVATLLPRWSLHMPDVVTATPTVVGDSVYVGAWDGTFDAIDLQSGAVRWSTTLGDRHGGSYGKITSSAAVATVDGKHTVFVGGGDSLYGLDAGNGHVRWSTNLDGAHPTSNGEIESSPVVWDGAPGGPVVVVGSDANQESGYTGEGVWAIRAATGAVVWHYRPETDSGHALYGCGNVWSSPALGLDPNNPDPSRRAVLYFGTADCPNNGHTACPADGADPYCPVKGSYDYAKRWGPYSEAIVALSAIDAKPLWTYQGHTPLNSDDDDYGASAQLFTLPDGRKVVGEGNKNGVYAVVDRASGALVWKRAEQGNGNLKSGFAIGGFLGETAVLRVGGQPRIFGGSAINTPITYDPVTGGAVVQPSGVLVRNLVSMQAFSGVDGAGAWSAPQMYTYGATTAANGVVYVGALDGLLRAYDAASGRLLWAFPLGAPVSSAASIGAGTLVIGAGTSESDVQFKLGGGALKPISNLNGVWAFALPQEVTHR